MAINTILAKPLLDLIASVESEPEISSQGVETGYDVVVQSAHELCKLPKQLTTMTLEEVHAWQRRVTQVIYGKYGGLPRCSAVGRYQLSSGTLLMLRRDMSFINATVFSPEVQDALAVQLLHNIGFKELSEGRIDCSKFADSLTKEWSHFPTTSGQSYFGKLDIPMLSREKVIGTLCRMIK